MVFGGCCHCVATLTCRFGLTISGCGWFKVFSVFLLGFPSMVLFEGTGFLL